MFSFFKKNVSESFFCFSKNVFLFSKCVFCFQTVFFFFTKKNLHEVFVFFQKCVFAPKKYFVCFPKSVLFVFKKCVLLFQTVLVFQEVFLVFNNCCCFHECFVARLSCIRRLSIGGTSLELTQQPCRVPHHPGCDWQVTAHCNVCSAQQIKTQSEKTTTTCELNSRTVKSAQTLRASLDERFDASVHQA